MSTSSASAAAHIDNPTRAIGIMCLAIAAMSIQDATAKLLIGDYSIVQIVFMRGLGGFLVLLPFFLRIPRTEWRIERRGLFALRVVLMIGGIGFFVSALEFLPLAEATAISHLAPLLVTILAAIFLGERIGPRRLAAVLVGLLGVLIVIRPGGDFFNAGALLALLGIASYCGMTVIMRVLVRGLNVIALTFWTQLSITVLAGVFVPFVWVQPETATIWALFTVQGILSAVAQYLFSEAVRWAPASTIAPFTYTNVLYMVALGYVMFGDVPQVATLIGMVVVVGAGVYIWIRERQLQRGITQARVQELGGPGEASP